MLDPICDIAWPIHSLRKSGSSRNPFPTISRVSHKYIDHSCLDTRTLQGVAEHFVRFPELAKNFRRFYLLEMRFGGHIRGIAQAWPESSFVYSRKGRLLPTSIVLFD